MTILTLIEHEQGAIEAQTLGMLTAVRALAEEQDWPVMAVLAGNDTAELAEDLGDYGVTAVYLMEHEGLDEYAPAAWAACVVEAMEREQPTAVIGAGTERSNEVMAHVAARTNLPFAANCLEIRPEEDAAWPVTRVRWGGTLREEAQLYGDPKLLTIAALGIEPEPLPEGDEPEIISVVPDLSDADLVARVVSRVKPEQKGISLTDAPVVVSGGRGVGSAEGFAVLEELAALLNGAVGCSRVATNNGWRPHADQIGQTGTRVAPDLYIACGISGASQHISGCAGAKHILAINIDPEAPILMKADTAVIGDLHEVLPAIVAELRQR
jgi:electron transfer flavoprotein alpha subunit